ncbi:MAG: hypothetical protein EBS53_13360 [Bacteroidetes bacterium]|nr:hypothetical protein [Bacteroidota bacterium]
MSNFADNKSKGYFDGSDGTFFLFCGQGQSGDQQMTRANEALAKARDIFVFESCGSDRLRFIGHAIYHDHFMVFNKDRSGRRRKAIVHRLRLGTDSLETAVPPVNPIECNQLGDMVEEIPLVACRVKPAMSSATSRESRRILQREGELVNAFKLFLESRNHKVTQLRITPRYAAAPIMSDLCTETFIAEAKGDTSRESIRMAIGQLADYGRFDKKKTKRFRVALLPKEPNRDLVSLLHAQHIYIVLQSGDEWVVLSPPRAKAGRPLW